MKVLNLPEKIKIVEKPGQKFSQVLKNHGKKEKKEMCDNPKCLMGKTKNGGDCRKNEIVYVIECKLCNDKYYGETARNGHTRGIQHVEDSESTNAETMEKSVLLRHMNEKHEGNKVQFEIKVVKSFQHDALTRQCAEAVWIKNIDPRKGSITKKSIISQEM